MRAEVEAFFARFKKSKPPATSQSLHATEPTGASATSSNQQLATTRHPLPVTRHSDIVAPTFHLSPFTFHLSGLQLPVSAFSPLSLPATRYQQPATAFPVSSFQFQVFLHLLPANPVKLTRFRSPYGLLPAVFLRYASILSKIHPKFINTMSSDLIPSDYAIWLAEVKTRIQSARSALAVTHAH